MPQRAHPALTAHAAQFSQDFVTLAPGVWQATGFGAGNVQVIEGSDSLVLINTTESTSSAKAVRAQIETVTQKPIRTIVYTHGHRDMIGGASVFADTDTEIIAAEGFKADRILKTAPSNQPTPNAARMLRVRRVTGQNLPRKERVSLGSGRGDLPMEGLAQGYLPPTRSVGPGGTVITRGGLKLDVSFIPGGHSDQLAIWHPTARTLFCADAFMAAFPDLAPLGGEQPNDLETWARSLDHLMSFNADHLAPAHTRPVSGRARVEDCLRDYRDAIRHIILATVEGLNAGRSVDALAATIKLPQALASKPHLQEVFGRVDWAVRGYAHGMLGWFDGNPTGLKPLAPLDEADRFIALAGGPDAVFAAAEEADDPQWALELCDRLILAGALVADARALKHACLRVLGESESNACARNYYLSCAQEMDV